MTEIRTLIASLNFSGLRRLLAENPGLSNKGIPFDDKNPATAHPLHRICDGVHQGMYTDEQATEIATIFFEYGARADGFGLEEKKDTPLIAAASLGAEKTGIFYIEHGASIHHAGTHGGTALHWAAWTGRDKLVEKLIRSGADVHKKCIDFTSTPLLWAVHGYKFDNGKNRHRQTECVRLLLAAGAEKNTFNKEGTRAIEFLSAADAELMKLLE